MKPVVLSELFQSLVNNALAQARIFINSEAGLMPTAFIGSSSTGEIAVVGMTFENERQKDEAGNAIRRIAQEHKADFVLFLAESWIIPAEHSETFMANRDKYSTVADSPLRKEVVSIFIETHTLHYIGHAGIVRDAKNQATVLEPVFTQADHMSGRFSHFLGPKAVVN